MPKEPQGLSGADVRAERARYNVTQQELAEELGWWPVLIGPVEDDKPQASQDQLTRMIEAVRSLAERKAVAK